MRLQQPGTRSNISLLLTSLWATASLTVLIGGHVLLLLLLWDSLQAHMGMAGLAIHTGLHTWQIWLWIMAALMGDVWVSLSARKQRQRAVQR